MTIDMSVQVITAKEADELCKRQKQNQFELENAETLAKIDNDIHIRAKCGYRTYDIMICGNYRRAERFEAYFRELGYNANASTKCTELANKLDAEIVWQLKLEW